MGKCLVTKLNGVVSNKSLNKIGEIKLILKSSSDNKASLLVHGNIVITSDITIRFEQPSNREEILTATQYDNSIRGGLPLQVTVPLGSTANISITNKYELTRISVFPYQNEIDYAKFNLSQLAFCKKLEVLEVLPPAFNGDFLGSIDDLVGLGLTTLAIYQDGFEGCLNNFANSSLQNIQVENNHKIFGDIAFLPNTIKKVHLLGNNFTGDIASLKNKTSINTINFNSPSIHGNIEELGNLINLSSVGFTDSQVTGAIETLCNRLLSAGKHDGTVLFNIYRTGITFNGSTFQGQKRATFSSNNVSYS